MTPGTRGAEDRLWAWCLKIYASPGVASSLIDAQDHDGADVPFLLWAAWCGSDARPLTARHARSVWDELAEWSRDVVGPVRSARRAAKSSPFDRDGGAYAGLKAAELACERAALDFLATRLPDKPADGATHADIGGNVERAWRAAGFGSSRSGVLATLATLLTARAEADENEGPRS